MPSWYWSCPVSGANDNPTAAPKLRSTGAVLQAPSRSARIGERSGRSCSGLSFGGLALRPVHCVAVRLKSSALSRVATRRTARRRPTPRNLLQSLQLLRFPVERDAAGRGLLAFASCRRPSVDDDLGVSRPSKHRRPRMCGFELLESRMLLAADMPGGSEVGDGALSGGVYLLGEDGSPGVGVAGAQIVLYDAVGQPIDAAATDADGVFAFDNLAEGLYGIKQLQPAGLADAGMVIGNGGGQILTDNLIGEIELFSGAQLAGYQFLETIGATVERVGLPKLSLHGGGDLGRTNVILQPEQFSAPTDAGNRPEAPPIGLTIAATPTLAAPAAARPAPASASRQEPSSDDDAQATFQARSRRRVFDELDWIDAALEEAAAELSEGADTRADGRLGVRSDGIDWGSLSNVDSDLPPVARCSSKSTDRTQEQASTPSENQPVVVCPPAEYPPAEVARRSSSAVHESDSADVPEPTSDPGRVASSINSPSAR